jgi:hypothetical protein
MAWAWQKWEMPEATKFWSENLKQRPGYRWETCMRVSLDGVLK